MPRSATARHELEGCLFLQEMVLQTGLDIIPQLLADGKYVGDADAVQHMVDEGSFKSLFSAK